MRIYWDHFGFREQHGGIAVYAEHMRQAFEASGIYPKPVVYAEAPAYWPKLLITKKPIWLHWLAHSWFPKNLGKEDEAVFHGLANFNIPLVSRRAFPHVRFLLTVHDIIPLLLNKSSILERQMHYLMPRRLERCDQIICVSSWTRETILERFKGVLSDQQVMVLPHGFNPSERRLRQNLAKDGAGRVLLVNRWESYKGFDLFQDIVLRSPVSWSFTVVTDGKDVEQLAVFQRKHPKIAERMMVRSGLPRSQLLHLYDQHDVLLQPSLFEGFGFSVQEAILRGCRVVYRKGSAMDDFGVCDGLLTMPREASVMEWLEAIESLLTTRHKESVHQALWIKAGSWSSWQESCHKLLNLYTLQKGSGGLQ